MTREEIIEGLKLLEDNMVYFDELLNDKGEYIDVHELLFEAIEVLEQEPCEEHQREFIELVVEYPNPDLCTYPEYRGKPYFSIKYRENGKYIVGFGSYKIEMISQWIKEYFMPSIQPKTEVLDKIRAEIREEMLSHSGTGEEVIQAYADGLKKGLKIIDKYKAESENKE